MMRSVWRVLMSTLCLGAQSETKSCDAQATWERMVEAKGGRTSLHRVESFLVRGSDTSWHGLVRRHIELTTLYVFPDFAWSWFDHGTSILGSSVTQFYADRG